MRLRLRTHWLATKKSFLPLQKVGESFLVPGFVRRLLHPVCNHSLRLGLAHALPCVALHCLRYGEFSLFLLCHTPPFDWQWSSSVWNTRECGAFEYFLTQALQEIFLSAEKDGTAWR